MSGFPTSLNPFNLGERPEFLSSTENFKAAVSSLYSTSKDVLEIEKNLEVIHQAFRSINWAKENVYVAPYQQWIDLLNSAAPYAASGIGGILVADGLSNLRQQKTKALAQLTFGTLAAISGASHQDHALVFGSAFAAIMLNNYFTAPQTIQKKINLKSIPEVKPDVGAAKHKAKESKKVTK